jgi:predicted alpha-1,2-mannosidase
VKRLGGSALAAVVLLLALPLAGQAKGAQPAPVVLPDLAGYVDPMIGTAPPGFVFPGASVPFGMVQNSPDTYGEFAYSGYLWTDPTIGGFSLVHLNGPGVKKAGDLPFMPVVGPVVASNYASPFDHATETASPGYYRATLARYATTVELTAGLRTARQRYTFPAGAPASVIMDVGRSVEGQHDGGLEVTGPAEVSGWSRGRYPVFFVARFSQPFESYTPFGTRPGGYVSFPAGGTVTADIGVSFVDRAGARTNLQSEHGDFDATVAAARAAWNRELNRVRVTGAAGATDLRIFYTALFHAQQHPNVVSDADGRYLGFDNGVHTVRGRLQYANFSSWDTYKAQNQLFATVQVERYREMLLSLAADYREGGRLPRWGEQNFDAAHMSGDPVIPMFADGLCRGIFRSEDNAAVADLYRGAVELTDRHRPAELATLGYLPDNPGTTLEYGVADFALALAAHALGHESDSSRFLAASLRYRSILDPETKWVRPRNADGSWYSTAGATYVPADEHGFQEGNSTQYSWLAPHDARGLIDAMGGDAVAVERLDQLFAAPPEVATKVTFFGVRYPVPQYAPGNEHDLQVPWMYPFAGVPARTQSVLSQIRQVFRPTPDGLPGNDDLGSLSAWYVWSALGFGPVTPGAPFFVVGSPQFEHVQLAVGRTKGTFFVDAPGAGGLAQYVQSATLGGRPLAASWFAASRVRSRATLRLVMGATAAPDAGRLDRPPSVADHPLDAFGCRSS